MARFTKVSAPPIHEQIAAHLRGWAASGRLGDDLRLPPEPELAQELGVSRGTLRKALDTLERQEIISRRKGRGTFVRDEEAARPKHEIFCCMRSIAMRERTSLVMTRVKGFVLQAARRGAAVHFIDAPAQFRPLGVADHAPVGVVFFSERERTRRFVEVDAFARERGWPTFVMCDGIPGQSGACGRREAGFEALARRMAELGHRRIALLNAEIRRGGYLLENIRSNRVGWVKGLVAAGLQPADEDYQETGMQFGPDLARTSAALDRLLALRPRPTALLCTNDELALAVMGMLAARGVCVPEDMSVAGFDGLPEGETSRPSLTTADQRLAAQGASAVDYVVDLLEGKESRPPVAAVRLVERQSTAPPGGWPAADRAAKDLVASGT